MNLLVNQNSNLIDFDLYATYISSLNNIKLIIYTDFPQGSYLIFKYVNDTLIDYRYIESDGIKITTMINPPSNNFNPILININKNENKKCSIVFDLFNYESFWNFTKINLC